MSRMTPPDDNDQISTIRHPNKIEVPALRAGDIVNFRVPWQDGEFLVKQMTTPNAVALLECMVLGCRAHGGNGFTFVPFVVKSVMSGLQTNGCLNPPSTVVALIVNCPVDVKPEPKVTNYDSLTLVERRFIEDPLEAAAREYASTRTARSLYFDPFLSHDKAVAKEPSDRGFRVRLKSTFTINPAGTQIIISLGAIEAERCRGWLERGTEVVCSVMWTVDNARIMQPVQISSLDGSDYPLGSGSFKGRATVKDAEVISRGPPILRLAAPPMVAWAADKVIDGSGGEEITPDGAKDAQAAHDDGTTFVGPLPKAAQEEMRRYDVNMNSDEPRGFDATPKSRKDASWDRPDVAAPPKIIDGRNVTLSAGRPAPMTIINAETEAKKTFMETKQWFPPGATVIFQLTDKQAEGCRKTAAAKQRAGGLVAPSYVIGWNVTNGRVMQVARLNRIDHDDLDHPPTGSATILDWRSWASETQPPTLPMMPDLPMLDLDAPPKLATHARHVLTGETVELSMPAHIRDDRDAEIRRLNDVVAFAADAYAKQNDELEQSKAVLAETQRACNVANEALISQRDLAVARDKEDLRALGALKAEFAALKAAVAAERDNHAREMHALLEERNAIARMVEKPDEVQQGVIDRLRTSHNEKFACAMETVEQMQKQLDASRATCQNHHENFKVQSAARIALESKLDAVKTFMRQWLATL